MRELITAAREGDFLLAKSIFDEAVAGGAIPREVVNATDGLGRTLLHYAAEYDEVVVFEWLWEHGADIFVLDSNNKSPVDISHLLDAKRRRKKHSGSEVLDYLKSSVLTPIQQMFYLENAESSTSVSSESCLAPLSNAQLSEKYPRYNNLDAAHILCLTDRLSELKYLHSRDVPLGSVDDDGNTLLHFAASSEMVDFLTETCRLDVNAVNSSEGFTPAHSLVFRVVGEEIPENVGVSLLHALIKHGADLSITCDSSQEGVAELVLDLIGQGALLDACLTSPTALGGMSLAEYLEKKESFSDSEGSSDLSVASHDDKVVGEDGEETDEEDEGEDENEQEQEEDVGDFFVRKSR